MRGYFLVAIILDHLAFFPSGLDWWSARGDLFVTTAEGFFLISGIVLGVVRGAKLVHEPLGKVTKLLLKRSLQLYITSVALVLAFTLVGWWLYVANPGLKYGIAPPGTNLFTLLWQTLTLQYFYGWADYLRLYAIFLFVSPLAFWLLRRGKWYVLLAGSLFVWLLFPASAQVPDPVQELFQPLSWQLIFFSGVTIGFYAQDIAAWWHRIPSVYRRMAAIAIVTLALATVCINAVVAFGPQYFDLSAYNVTDHRHYELYVEHFDKERLPLERLALFALWFAAAFFAFNRFKDFISRWLGWLLLQFGTNSLFVYTMHAIVIFFVHLYLQPGNVLYNFVISIACIAVIYGSLQIPFLKKIIPR